MALQPVYVLVGDLFFASKIVKTAQALGLEVRAFDTANRLLEASKEKKPALIIMDCEKLEKEAFHLLATSRSDEALSKVPKLGYLSHVAEDLKKEMRSAGCEQVYAKSQFTRELENILMRYTNGFPSRI